MKVLKEIKQDPAFLKRVAVIAIPITLQSLLNTVLNFVDTVMIGRLGETTISAVGLANKVFFVLCLLLFGICSGSGILASQYWGKRDVDSIHKVVGLSMSVALVASFIFTLFSFLKPELVMRIFTNSEQTIAIGAKYLRIVCLSYMLSAVTQIFMSALRSVNQVKLPVIISVIAIITNVILNYILIFGKFGAPALGVQGAAIATLIARCVECVAMTVFVYAMKSPVAATIRQMFSFGMPFIKKFFKLATPVIINEFMWGLGVTIYSVAYGRMGDDAVAAITVTQSIEQILQVVFMGVGNAAAVILGNELGAGELSKAERHAKYFIVMQGMMSFVIILLGIVFMKPIVAIFQMTEASTIHSVYQCLYAFLGFLFFKVFNLVNIVGILRSGGDTKAALFLDMTGVWLIGIPMAFLGGLVFKLPVAVVYALVFTEEIYKMILGFIRYRKKKWLKNIVSDEKTCIEA